MPAFSLDAPAGISTAYSTNFMQNEASSTGAAKNIAQPAIFKFTDNNGKITYSTAIPHDFIEAEEVLVTGPPSERYIEETKQFNAELRDAGQQLTDAREERKALRDEKEKKRLERLALINRSKPPVVYQQNNDAAYPYQYRRARHYSGYRQHKKPYHKKPTHLPAAGAHSSRHPIRAPFSGASHALHR